MSIWVDLDGTLVWAWVPDNGYGVSGPRPADAVQCGSAWVSVRPIAGRMLADLAALAGPVSLITLSPRAYACACVERCALPVARIVAREDLGAWSAANAAPVDPDAVLIDDAGPASPGLTLRDKLRFLGISGSRMIVVPPYHGGTANHDRLTTRWPAYLARIERVVRSPIQVRAHARTPEPL